MSSMIAILLHKGASPVLTSGRVIRFGVPGSKVLTVGPVRDRVMSCLASSSVPMRISDIAEAVEDCEARVQKALRGLAREGQVEEIGVAGSAHLRFRII